MCLCADGVFLEQPCLGPWDDLLFRGACYTSAVTSPDKKNAAVLAVPIFGTPGLPSEFAGPHDFEPGDLTSVRDP